MADTTDENMTAGNPASNAALDAFNALSGLERATERLRMSKLLAARAFYPNEASEPDVKWMTRCALAQTTDGRQVIGVVTGITFEMATELTFLHLMTDVTTREVVALRHDEIAKLFGPRPDHQLLTFSGRAPRERKTKDGTIVTRTPRERGPRTATLVDLAALGVSGVDINKLHALITQKRDELAAQREKKSVVARFNDDADDAPVAVKFDVPSMDDDDEIDPYADDPEVQAMRALHDQRHVEALIAQEAIAHVVHDSHDDAAYDAFNDAHEAETDAPEPFAPTDEVVYEIDPDVFQGASDDDASQIAKPKGRGGRGRGK